MKFSPIALCAFLAGATPASWALPTQYRLQDLGPATVAEHIGASGAAVGEVARDHLLPAAWIDGVETRLARSEGLAHGVNAAGAVVGSLSRSGAAVWSKAGRTDLGTILGWPSSDAVAINDGGACAVNAVVDGSWHAFLLPDCTGSEAVDLGSLGTAFVLAEAINAKGQVAGTAAVTQGERRDHAFLYAKGRMKDLGVMRGCVSSNAYGLDRHGHVVGRCADKEQQPMGFFWNGKKMSAVGTLGGPHSVAYGINGSDVVVGSAQTAAGEWHAFILDEATHGAPIQDLSTMLDASGAHWHVESAVDINDAGQILVRGWIDGDASTHSAVLSPLD